MKGIFILQCPLSTFTTNKETIVSNFIPFCFVTRNRDIDCKSSVFFYIRWSTSICSTAANIRDSQLVCVHSISWISLNYTFFEKCLILGWIQGWMHFLQYLYCFVTHISIFILNIKYLFCAIAMLFFNENIFG